MAITKIEINTTRLSADIRSLQETLNDARNRIQELKGKMDAMNTMWEGDANEVMRHRFLVDYENLISFCDFIEELIQSLETIRHSYENCEGDVMSAVNALSIN